MSRYRQSSRKENTRAVRPRFLLVCEDGKTAPGYFSGFRLSSATIIAVGTGMNTLRLVNEAISIRDKMDFRGSTDQVWVVMDRDAFPKANYDNAIIKALAHNLRIAYSNECLEVWFLLHFTPNAKYLHRSKIPSLLSNHLGTKYIKGMSNIYKLLSPLQDNALSNSEALRSHHLSYTSAQDLHNCCPVTSVDELVREFRKYLR